MCLDNFDSMLRYSADIAWEPILLEMKSKALVCLSIFDGCLSQTSMPVTPICFTMLAKPRRYEPNPICYIINWIF